jgi:hypothetical protein
MQDATRPYDTVDFFPVLVPGPAILANDVIVYAAVD